MTAVGSEAAPAAEQVVKENLSPVWNETFVFPAAEVQASLRTSPLLRFQVWDWDMLSENDFLGQVCR